MYKSFYQLKRNPFEITPDPSFLFATKRHNEALAALYYGVKRKKGFVVMTGEVGTGKTLLVRCLLQVLKRANISYAYVFNPVLTPAEFLQYIAGDFQIPTTAKSKSELLLDLSAFVIARHQKQLTTVLVIDEAHHLSTEVLEEVRLLTNLETPQEKLLQILLIGQQELDQKLDSVSLRQLKQRIALRSHLTALDLDETRGYLDCRLKLAGCADSSKIFPKESVSAIFRHSRGLPRLINTICENALIQGYAKQTPCISPETIEDVATDLRLNVVHPSKEDEAQENSKNIERAAKTLLDLYTYLQGMQEGDSDVGMRMVAGVREQ